MQRRAYISRCPKIQRKPVFFYVFARNIIIYVLCATYLTKCVEKRVHIILKVRMTLINSRSTKSPTEMSSAAMQHSLKHNIIFDKSIRY